MAERTSGYVVGNIERTADMTHDYISALGWLCAFCHHRHLGMSEGGICVGCLCSRRHPTIDEFDRMRRVRFDAPIDDPRE